MFNTCFKEDWPVVTAPSCTWQHEFIPSMRLFICYLQMKQVLYDNTKRSSSQQQK